MGPRDLLAFFKKVQKRVHLQDFSEKRVAVDGNYWLEQGASLCAEELVRNKPTTKHISYFMEQVNHLKAHKVEPIIVFDGDVLPIKYQTYEQMYNQQEQAAANGYNYLHRGQQERARASYQKAVHITPHMKNQIYKALDEKRIEYIQAPYESAAQLTSLCKTGSVSAVISENTNLLAHGCPTVLFKLKPNGNATQIQHQDMFANLGRGLDFRSWDNLKLRDWLLLAGCTDYMPIIPTVALKMAYKYMKHHETTGDVVIFLKRAGKVIDPSFDANFERAKAALLYQYVYPIHCNTPRRVTIIRETSQNDYDFLGDRPTICVRSAAESVTPPVTSTPPSDASSANKRRRTILGPIINTYDNPVAVTSITPTQRPMSSDDEENIPPPQLGKRRR